MDQFSKMSSQELDALAHEAVFGDKPVEGQMFSSAIVDGRSQRLPSYSTDLNDAAQLVEGIIKRNLYSNWYVKLGELVNPMAIPIASAKNRTIAAILAVRESAHEPAI